MAANSLSHIFFLGLTFFLFFGALSQPIQDQQHQDLSQTNQRCAQTPASSEKLERAIQECQDEIKLAILQEALESLQEGSPLSLKSRERRDTEFSKDEKTIAGCLLQCVYRKVGAADVSGYPDPDGLVKFYVDGVEDQAYQGAAKIAVNLCTREANLRRVLTPVQDSDDTLLFGRQRRRIDFSVLTASAHHQKHSPDAPAGGGAQACNEAFDVFQCIADKLETYCGKN